MKDYIRDPDTLLGVFFTCCHSVFDMTLASITSLPSLEAVKGLSI